MSILRSSRTSQQSLLTVCFLPFVRSLSSFQLRSCLRWFPSVAPPNSALLLGPTLVYLNAEALVELGSRFGASGDGAATWAPHQAQLLSLVDNIPQERREYAADNDQLSP